MPLLFLTKLAHLLPLPSPAPSPPFYAIYPNSTMCGSDLFPGHLYHAERAIEWLGCDSTKDWTPRCYHYLQWQNNRTLTPIRNATQIAHNEGRDDMHAKFVAAMGHNWYRDDESVKALPEIDPSEIHILDISLTETYFVIKPEDMTAPVMRGRNFKAVPPYDNRPFFAVKVMDVETGLEYVQTFMRRFADDDYPYGYWTGHRGVLLETQGEKVTDAHLEQLTNLCNGQTVTTYSGHRVRLACATDEHPVIRVPGDDMPRVTLCDRIGNLISRAFTALCE